MLLAHYAHRLPVGHDLRAIRERAARRGPDWDATPDLVFKAFLLRERGRLGAAADSYASLYLWRQAGALAAFVGDPRFAAVTDSFGRPAIETRPVLAAYRGPQPSAQVLIREDRAIGPDAGLAAVVAGEDAWARAEAGRDGIVAAVAAIDPERWSLTRVVLRAGAPEPGGTGTAHGVLYLAAPLLGTLERPGERSR